MTRIDREKKSKTKRPREAETAKQIKRDLKRDKSDITKPRKLRGERERKVEGGKSEKKESERGGVEIDEGEKEKKQIGYD